MCGPTKYDMLQHKTDRHTEGDPDCAFIAGQRNTELEHGEEKPEKKVQKEEKAFAVTSSGLRYLFNMSTLYRIRSVRSQKYLSQMRREVVQKPVS